MTTLDQFRDAVDTLRHATNYLPTEISQHHHAGALGVVLGRLSDLEDALREMDEEVVHWHKDYLLGGSMYEHPRGSGWDRVHKKARTALTGGTTF